MRRHSSRRSSSRQRLGRLWNRFFHRPRARGQVPLLHSARTSQTVLGDGILNCTDGATAESLPASPEEACGPPGGVSEPGNSPSALEAEATEVPSTESVPSPCPAALPDAESQHSCMAEDAPEGRLPQAGKADSGRTFRDPLLERVTEIHQRSRRSHGRTAGDGRHSQLLREELRHSMPLKNWESGYRESHGALPLRGEHRPNGDPHSCREEPFGIHPPCCHSMEVPIPAPPLPERSPSDDESLLVC